MERNFIDGYTEWQSNPEIVAVNQLPQHATFMPYETFEEAKRAGVQVYFLRCQVGEMLVEHEAGQRLDC